MWAAGLLDIIYVFEDASDFRSDERLSLCPGTDTCQSFSRTNPNMWSQLSDYIYKTFTDTPKPLGSSINTTLEHLKNIFPIEISPFTVETLKSAVSQLNPNSSSVWSKTLSLFHRKYGILQNPIELTSVPPSNLTLEGISFDHFIPRLNERDRIHQSVVSSLQQISTFNGIRIVNVHGVACSGKTWLCDAYVSSLISSPCNYAFVWKLDASTEVSFNLSCVELLIYLIGTHSLCETYSIVQRIVLELGRRDGPFLLYLDNAPKSFPVEKYFHKSTKIASGIVLVTCRSSQLSDDRVSIPFFTRECAVSLFSSIPGDQRFQQYLKSEGKSVTKDMMEMIELCPLSVSLLSRTVGYLEESQFQLISRLKQLETVDYPIYNHSMVFNVVIAVLDRIELEHMKELFTMALLGDFSNSLIDVAQFHYLELSVSLGMIQMTKSGDVVFHSIVLDILRDVFNASVSLQNTFLSENILNCISLQSKVIKSSAITFKSFLWISDSISAILKGRTTLVPVEIPHIHLNPLADALQSIWRLQSIPNTLETVKRVVDWLNSLFSIELKDQLNRLVSNPIEVALSCAALQSNPSETVTLREFLMGKKHLDNAIAKFVQREDTFQSNSSQMNVVENINSLTEKEREIVTGFGVTSLESAEEAFRLHFSRIGDASQCCPLLLHLADVCVSIGKRETTLHIISLLQRRSLLDDPAVIHRAVRTVLSVFTGDRKFELIDFLFRSNHFSANFIIAMGKAVVKSNQPELAMEVLSLMKTRGIDVNTVFDRFVL